MVFGLPAIGEGTWGQKILDSINAVKATADAAQPSATLDAGVTAVDANAASALRVQQDARLSATYQLKDRPLVVTPEQFGAVGDGATDDTVAVQAAIDAVAANGGGTVLFGVGGNYGKVYLCNAAPRTDRRGHSILSLPATGSGTIVLTGFGKMGPGPWSWIKSTRTTDAYSALYGPPSVVGGPTTENSTGTTLQRFSNWNVVIDGLGLGLPSNPKLAGYDLRKMISARVDNLSVFAETVTGSYVQPTSIYSFGIGLPSGLNSGNMPVDAIQVFGMYAGLILSSPHADIRSILTKWCYIGVGMADDILLATGDAHASRIGYWQSENCTYHLAGWSPTVGAQQNAATTTTRLNIDLWDIEDAPAANWFTTTYHVLDQNNTLRGTAVWNRTLGGVGPTDAELTVLGATDYSLQLLGGLNMTGPWRSYTAAVGGTGWALGDGTVVSRYTQAGKTVHFVAQFTFGATSTYGAGGLTISLPKTRSGFAAVHTVVVRMVDSSTGKVYTGTADIGNGASAATVRHLLTATNGEAPSVVSTSPFAWASGDQVTVSGTYEVA